MVSSRQRFSGIFILLLFGVGGFLCGFFLFGGMGRRIDSTRAEGCLKAFIEHRKSGDSEVLKKKLEKLAVTPGEFEKIMDLFAHFRVSQSAMNQAMALLQAFQRGSQIVPEKAEWGGGNASYSFQMEAEVLTVMKEKPELIKEAFGG